MFFTKEEVYDQSRLRDFTFTFDETSDSYFIKSYLLAGSAPTTVDIPSKYRNKNVTKILAKAFVSANGMKTINIPETISTIEESAFLGLPTLTNFVVSENNINYTTIDGVLFSKNKEHLLAYPDGKGTTYSIPTTTKYIDSYAFNSTDIIDIKLNEGLTSIGDYAFEGCTGLINFVMSNTVTDLGKGAFKTCSNMKTITLSNTLKELKDSTFQQVLALTEIDIPGSVKSIGSSCFLSNSKMIKITLNEGLEEIKDNGLSYITGVSSITLSSTVKKIGNSSFAGNDLSLKTVVLNEGLETIGDMAFYVDKYLETINIPSTVTSIGEDAFCATTSLKYITVSENNGVFAGDNGVLFNKDKTTLVHYPSCKVNTNNAYTVPDSVTTLGYRSFSYVSQSPSKSSTTLYSLKTLNLSNKISNIKNSFYGANAITINFAGTKAEFQTLADNSKFTDSSSNIIEWDTGSNSPKFVCTDGTYEG